MAATSPSQHPTSGNKDENPVGENPSLNERTKENVNPNVKAADKTKARNTKAFVNNNETERPGSSVVERKAGVSEGLAATDDKSDGHKYKTAKLVLPDFVATGTLGSNSSPPVSNQPAVRPANVDNTSVAMRETPAGGEPGHVAKERKWLYRANRMSEYRSKITSEFKSFAIVRREIWRRTT